jgi:hypothetical protein
MNADYVTGKDTRLGAKREHVEAKTYECKTNNEEWCLLGCYAVWLL